MKFNKKILTSLLAVGVLFSIALPNAIKANEEGITTYALTDPAFPDSSRPLEEAIIAKYNGTGGTIKVDTNDDGFISQGEANAWGGDRIIITNQSFAIGTTLNGIEYFTNPALTSINLENNGLTGNIPSSIDNISGLEILNLRNNSLTGDIPTSIGNLEYLSMLVLTSNGFTGNIPNEIGNLNNLETLRLNGNQLSGEIPASIGNLTNLTELVLNNNQLSGEIPNTIGKLINLQQLALQTNNFNGEIPEEIYTIASLEVVKFHENQNLTGNPAEGFTNHPNLTELSVHGTGLTQAPPNVLYGGNCRYDNLAEGLLNVDGSLKEGLTQEDIDRAQDSANYWDDSTKSEWQTKIDIAQELLNQRDAENAVNDLFNPDETIKDSVSQKDIDNAQDLIDKVTDVDKKQELQDNLDDAQKQLDEKTFTVLEGFQTFTGTGTVSTTIDAPVEKFSKVYVDGKLLPSSNYVVTSGSTVITLNESYLKILENGTYDVEVEFASGAKVSVPLTVDVKTITDPINPVDPVDPIDPTDPVKPTDPTTPTNPIVTKPSVDGKPSVAGGTTVSGNNSVNTGDETNTMMLYAMLATSLLGLIVVIKRRKEIA